MLSKQRKGGFYHEFAKNFFIVCGVVGWSKAMGES